MAWPSHRGHGVYEQQRREIRRSTCSTERPERSPKTVHAERAIEQLSEGSPRHGADRKVANRASQKIGLCARYQPILSGSRAKFRGRSRDRPANKHLCPPDSNIRRSMGSTEPAMFRRRPRQGRVGWASYRHGRRPMTIDTNPAGYEKPANVSPDVEPINGVTYVLDFDVTQSRQRR